LLNVHTKMVLQNSYCHQLKAQLGAEEKKRKTVKSKKTHLHSDNMPCILTDDAFYQSVVAVELATKREENQPLQQMAACEAYNCAVEEWQHNDDARKQRNIALQQWYADLKKEWEDERDCAKRAKTK
ncbi:hypothetical protein BKA62DRAFT_593498, partial [Auriculariales sp. MPI-PUGE-AT-0066]